MDKKNVSLSYWTRRSPILAGKEEAISGGQVEKLQSALLVAKEDVASRDGEFLGTSLSGLVQTISNASLMGANLCFTDQERPVWEEF